MSKRREYRPLSEKPVTAIYWLFQHYGKNSDFMKEFGEFIDAYEAELAKHPMPEKMDESAPLISHAKELADKGGLNAPWAPAKIIREAQINYHYRWEAVINGVKPNPTFKYRFPLNAMVIMHGLPAPDEMWVRLDMEYDPSRETRAAFLNRAKQELELQVKVIEKRFEARGMVPQEQKSELETHVLWLYERIALRLTPSQIVYKHRNDSRPPGQHAVEDGIRKVAHLLEITLPHNRVPVIH